MTYTNESLSVLKVTELKEIIKVLRIPSKTIEDEKGNYQGVGGRSKYKQLYIDLILKQQTNNENTVHGYYVGTVDYTLPIQIITRILKLTLSHPFSTFQERIAMLPISKQIYKLMCPVIGEYSILNLSEVPSLKQKSALVNFKTNLFTPFKEIKRLQCTQDILVQLSKIETSKQVIDSMYSRITDNIEYLDVTIKKDEECTATMVGSMKNLRWLKLNMEMNDQECKTIYTKMMDLKQLQNLWIKHDIIPVGMKFSKEMAKKSNLFQYFKNQTTVTSLNITRYGNYGKDVVNHLTIYPGLTSLTMFNLNPNEKIELPSHLTDLKLICNHGNDSNATSIFQGLSKQLHLKNLTISHFNLEHFKQNQFNTLINDSKVESIYILKSIEIDLTLSFFNNNNDNNGKKKKNQPHQEQLLSSKIHLIKSYCSKWETSNSSLQSLSFNIQFKIPVSDDIYKLQDELVERLSKETYQEVNISRISLVDFQYDDDDSLNITIKLAFSIKK